MTKNPVYEAAELAERLYDMGIEDEAATISDALSILSPKHIYSIHEWSQIPVGSIILVTYETTSALSEHASWMCTRVNSTQAFSYSQIHSTPPLIQSWEDAYSLLTTMQHLGSIKLLFFNLVYNPEVHE